MQGTINIAFSAMAILLIFWFCASITFCVAFLGVAVRQAPRMAEQMVDGYEPALRQATAVVLEKPKTAYSRSGAKTPSPLPVLRPACSA